MNRDSVRTMATGIGLSAGVAMVISGFFTVIAIFSEMLHPRRAVLGFYFIGFGSLSIFAELGWTTFTTYFPFLNSHFGRGVWYIFVGLLAMEESSLTFTILSMATVAVGFMNILLSFNLVPEKKGKGIFPGNVKFNLRTDKRESAGKRV